MISFISCVLTATLTLVHAGPSPHLVLPKDEICKKDVDVEWRCRPAEDCRHDQVVEVGSRPICGYSDDKPLVCCPNQRPKRASKGMGRGSKATAYCQERLSEFCSDLNITLTDFDFLTGDSYALPKEFPEMALIGFGDEKSKSWLCGGTLINERYVLSAAHCITSYFAGDAKWVRLGDLDYADEEDIAEPQDFNIVEAIPHPEYQEPALYHDIALFKLDREVRFTEFVRPACLHTSPTVPFDKVTATGWGSTGSALGPSSSLMAVEISMMNHTVCSDLRETGTWMPEGVKTETMVCAGLLEGEKDICTGDSGGPLVVGYGGRCLNTQVGVMSSGGICGMADSPGVYTRVSHYIPWIESIVWS